jgi:YihY family inner membrane protein
MPTMSNGVARRARAIPYPGIFTTLRYVMRPETQTFAFSVATMSVLAFFPFMIVLIMLIRQGIESSAMYDVLLQILRDHLPIGQDFVIRALSSLVTAHRQTEIVSLLLLFLTARMVFVPMEVALNRIWGFERSRSWLHNQLVGIGLILLCGLLAVLSVGITAVNQYVIEQAMGGHRKPMARLGAFLAMKLVATAASVSIFFVIYWLVPNGKISARRVFPVALWFGILWELMKYGYIVLLPHMNFQAVYGPFAASVALIFWGYFSGLILLAGAFISAGVRG